MRRALTKLLPEDHPSIEKRSCKRRDNNERPKYQNVRVSFSSAAFSFDSVLAVGRAAHCRSGWGCFHLSLCSTEMAERSSRTKLRRSENSRDRTNTRTPRAPKGQRVLSRRRQSLSWSNFPLTQDEHGDSLPNCRFNFHKGGQLLMSTHNEAFTVAMRVGNEDYSPKRIDGCNAAPAPTGSAEIVGDAFPIFHLTSSVVPFRRTAWLSFIVFSARARRRVFGSADRFGADRTLDRAGAAQE
jgi:hypothetical protein